MKKTHKIILLDSQRGNCIGLIQCIKDRVAMFPEDSCKVGQLGIGVNISEGVKQYWKPVNLHIISDDEIKEGDYYILIPENKIKQFKGITYNLPIHRDWKKIVATTDKSLKIVKRISVSDNVIDYPDYVPQLPESFIQAYIKTYNEGKPITEVDLEMEQIPLTGRGLSSGYKLVIKTRLDNTVIIRETKLYNFEDLCSLTTFIRENNHKWEGKGITNTAIIEQWKNNGEI